MDCALITFVYGTATAFLWSWWRFSYRNKISLVPARPEDVRDLMEGLVQQAERFRQNSQSMDAVIMAASVAFGFVFIHPFMDGNGRLHRYLIHEILSAAGFTPKGIVYRYLPLF